MFFSNLPSDGSNPVLPDPIPDPMPSTDDPIGLTPTANTPFLTPVQPFPGRWPWRFRSLRHGCYLIRYTPKSASPFFRIHYDGTMRIERDRFNTTASGDLYAHFPLVVAPFPFGRPKASLEPSPGNGIPIFPRSRYRYYLRVTQVLENWTIGSSFSLGFQMYRYNRTTKTWTNEGSVSALMSWTTAPSGYPSSSDYLEGDVKNSSGTIIGRLTMGWVSKYLRRAVIEVDRVSQSEYPANNGSSIDWQDAYDHVGWHITAYESDTALSEPSGQAWSNSELHQKMLAKRDSSNLDTEWRYHLLCVRGLDATSRGIMYDAAGTDSNNVPREGAAISSHWVIPNETKWGTVQGQRFGSASAPYFRTAVHELGHAMGLRHNTADNGFMNTTGVIAGNPGTFPANVQWSFNSEDAKKLRHMPDAWIRPGEIPWAPSYSDPISPDDFLADAEGLQLTASALLESVPIGAPVRVSLTLQNSSNQEALVPASLSLKSEHVTGRVIGPHGEVRTFRSVIRCIEENETEVLQAEGRKYHDLTLLRGAEGALFPAPGAYQIHIDVTWEVDGVPVLLSNLTSVMITPPVDDDHAVTALKVISEPDSLLALAIGGDHLKNGLDAIHAALKNPVLRPHFAVIEAKRLGTRFGKRAADMDKALGLIDEQTVLSGVEMRKVAELVQNTKSDSRKSSKVKLVVTTLHKKVGYVVTDDAISKMVKRL